jgi:propanol-preferring alcohol dehydrogenase
VNGFSDSFGGFSEYSLAHPASTVKLPDGLDFTVYVEFSLFMNKELIEYCRAAPLFCAGITAYSALLKAKSNPGQLINIVGCGGVGKYPNFICLIPN